VKAVVIERPHEVVYREVETPNCGPGEVLVRSRFAGLCRTDVEVLESGVGEAVGTGVTGLEAGDSVVCEGCCYAIELATRLPLVVGRILPEHGKGSGTG
jgi:L-iditol 2-dehydrogenase